MLPKSLKYIHLSNPSCWEKYKKNMPGILERMGSQRWIGYVVALGGTALAALLRWQLDKLLGEGIPPYITFYPIAMASSLLGGIGAGVLATFLSAGVVAYFFLEPAGFGIEKSADIAAFILFILVNLLISLCCGALRIARLRTFQEKSLLAERVAFLDLTSAFVRGPDDKIIHWGIGCERLYGFTQAQAVGAFSHELLRTRSSEPLEEARATLLETGRWEGDLGRTTADGRELFVNSVWVLCCDARGSPTATLEHSTDITARKQSEETLRRSEERFRRLAEVTSQVVWVSKPSGEPAEDSPSWRAFTGCGPEKWVGWDWLELVHPNDRHAVANAWRSALTGLFPYKDEFRLRHASGIYRDVSASAVPVCNADGSLREWIGSLKDVTSSKRAEAARNSLLALIDGSNDAIVSETLGGVVTSWNRGAERIFGYSAQEILAKEIMMLIPPDRRDEEQRLLEAVRRGETIEHYESQRLTKDGRLIDVSISLSPVRDSVGRIVGASKVARDITERKRAEEQLRLQSAAMHAAGNGIVITGLDGTIEWANESFARMTGYSVAEAIGKNSRVLKSGQHDKAFFQSLWETVLAGHNWQGELVNKRKDGQLYHEEMMVTPVADTHGRITHFIAIKHDITERKRVEMALRESEERYRSLFENMLNGFAHCRLLFDEDGRPSDFVCLDVNPAFYRLTGLKNVVGRKSTDFLPGVRAEQPELFASCARVATTGQSESFETEIRRLRGWFSISIYSSQRNDFVAFFENITERKRAEAAIRQTTEQLARANEELERKVEERTLELTETIAELEHFSYAIIHDMRAPLRSMCGFSTILLTECHDGLDPSHRELLRNIGESAGRMDRLILNSLDYSKVLREKLPMVPVEVETLLHGLMVTYPRFQPPHAEIRIEGEWPRLLGNRAGLMQCCSNLLDNAVKFVEPGRQPKVRVWAERRGELARIWFEDNGIGIAPEWQARVFDLFQRVERTPGSTGIGLALARKVIQRMGGNVGVESELGKGSRFWLELKALESKEAT